MNQYVGYKDYTYNSDMRGVAYYVRSLISAYVGYPRLGKVLSNYSAIR